MIKLNNVNVKFDKRGIAGLHSVSIENQEGEVIAIMGPNGSGKTTLLKVLSGQLVPDSGSVTLKNNFSFFPEKKIDEDINVQKFLISNVTLDISEEKKIQLSRDLADTFEFTFQLRQKVSELSSGQKQKVLLSKELINHPSILFMDEPFTHLDPFTRKEILTGLFQYIRQQNITVIWVTHDLEEAFKFSDRIGILNFGRLEQVETPIELIRKPKNLFLAQFIGYRNFIALKNSPEGWISPWGKVDLPPNNQVDSLLVVPDHAWHLSEENGIDVLIKEFFAGKQLIEYCCEFMGQKLYFSRGSALPLIEKDSKIKIIPKFDECFLISL